jgi:ubiquinone/menaquinone biosynthesis C-methylase UbiE
MQKQPDYGIDAPLVIAIQLVVSASAFALAVVLFALGVPYPLGIPLGEVGLVLGVNFLVNVAGMFWYSKIGKLRQRERLLDGISWRGDETVLDVGCGRELLLIGAARRLTSGKAIGVDIWQRKSMVGNRLEAALENARLEGVAERVEVQDADARQLPFPGASFDVVLSALVLHNIPGQAGRQQAAREMARVLKPGGQVALLGIKHTSECVRVLREGGLSDAKRSTAGFLFWWFAILTWGSVQFFRVTGKKVAAATVA